MTPTTALIAAWHDRRVRAAARHRNRCADAIGEHRAGWARWLESSERCERARRGHVGPDWQATAAVALALARELGLRTGELRQLAYVAHHAAMGPQRDAQLAYAQLTLCVAAVRAGLPVAIDHLSGDRELVSRSFAAWDRDGEAIPELCRVVAVARTYSLLTAATPYRAAHSRETALEQLARTAGRELDPSVVAALPGAVDVKLVRA